MNDEESQDQGQDEEAVPFDDCLRILVNTPPMPKKAEGKPSADEGEEGATAS